jgi:hypothetical protein
MSHLSEGRVSDSPYVEMIWRGRAGSAYAPTCPADSRWNLLLLRRGDGKLTVSFCSGILPLLTMITKGEV